MIPSSQNVVNIEAGSNKDRLLRRAAITRAIFRRHVCRENDETHLNLSGPVDTLIQESIVLEFMNAIL